MTSVATTFSITELEQAGERELGTSDWHLIDQARIDRFADATDDHQWIHVDPEAAAKGPFGTTVAHGYLTLTLVPHMLHEIFTTSGTLLSLNYGTEKVRFTSPVLVDSRIRLHAKLLRTVRRELGLAFYLDVRVEVEGQEKPALVGELVFLAVDGGA